MESDLRSISNCMVVVMFDCSEAIRKVANDVKETGDIDKLDKMSDAIYSFNETCRYAANIIKDIEGSKND
jgi:hypothetical protein